MCKLQTVPFNGRRIISLEKDGVVYVPIKRLCENLGIDWDPQRVKLSSDSKFSYLVIKATGSDRKQYEMGCLPFKKLNGWLFSINPKRIKNPSIKEKIVKYQEECFDVLYKYWAKKHKKNPNWLEAREQSIDIRHAETDMIQEFVEYAYKQGSKSANRYYMLFSKECKKDVGYESDRKDASFKHLTEASLVDKIIMNGLTELMKQNIFYKDIYKEIVKRIQTVASIACFDGIKKRIGI